MNDPPSVLGAANLLPVTGIVKCQRRAVLPSSVAPPGTCPDPVGRTAHTFRLPVVIEHYHRVGDFAIRIYSVVEVDAALGGLNCTLLVLI